MHSYPNPLQKEPLLLEVVAGTQLNCQIDQRHQYHQSYARIKCTVIHRFNESWKETLLLEIVTGTKLRVERFQIDQRHQYHQSCRDTKTSIPKSDHFQFC